MCSRGPTRGDLEHRDYFAGASALYDLASASILISTKTGLVHFMANSLFPWPEANARGVIAFASSAV